MIFEFRLSDEDRERWGGPEWVPLDVDSLASLGFDKLWTLERPMKRSDGLTLSLLLSEEWPSFSMMGVRGMNWIARQLAGEYKPDWDDFKLDVINSTFRTVKADDADPPAGGSSEPSLEKATRSKKA